MTGARGDVAALRVIPATGGEPRVEIEPRGVVEILSPASVPAAGRLTRPATWQAWRPAREVAARVCSGGFSHGVEEVADLDDLVAEVVVVRAVAVVEAGGSMGPCSSWDRSDRVGVAGRGPLCKAVDCELQRSVADSSQRYVSELALNSQLLASSSQELVRQGGAGCGSC